jgi:hypothetical protein
MTRTGSYLGIACAAMAIVLPDCSQLPPDLATSLKGIDRAQFLGCSGPPLLDNLTTGQERMSFVTDLKRGSAIGIAGPTALPPESCSVDTVFVDQHLVSANFSGNLAMCNQVFAPCLQEGR